jgi:hypothetical protein
VEGVRDHAVPFELAHVANVDEDHVRIVEFFPRFVERDGTNLPVCLGDELAALFRDRHGGYR